MTAKAIPFVEVLDDKFLINQEAVDFIESLPQPVAVIACAGGYRTGKSLFLNRGLLQLSNGKGFAVGNSTNACTKGLWIHTSLLKLARASKDGSDEKEYVNVLFIDTEGLGAFDANDTHDAKIFALALLLCSYFIYNSVGKIDEDSIGKLSLVCNVCKQIRASAEEKDTEEGETKKRKRDDESSADALSEYFPRFLWLLRDFSLMLQDSEGAPITSKQYLESALADKAHTRKEGDVQKSIDEKNQLRRMLRKLFVQRDCATLMRPCVEESQLQSLDALGDNALRPEFLQQMQALRRKILLDAPTKLALENRPISGRGLVQLCRSYVDAFNRGAAPVIRDSWNLLLEVQCRDAIDVAKSCFITSLATLMQKQCPDQCKGLTRVKLDQTVAALVDGTIDSDSFRLELPPNVLEQILETAVASAVQKYISTCGGQLDDYRKRLDELLDAITGRIRMTNARGLDQIVKRAADDVFQRVLLQITSQIKQQLLTKDKIKLIWPQMLQSVEDGIGESLSSHFDTSNDQILQHMIQKTLKARYEQWVPQIEDFWFQCLKSSCDAQLSSLSSLETQLQQVKLQADLQRESCESHVRERDETKVLLESERKLNVDQKIAFDLAIAKHVEEQNETLAKQQADLGVLEKELQEAQVRCDVAISEANKTLIDLRSENAALVVQRDFAVSSVESLEKRCAQMSLTMDQMHEENESLVERVKLAEQTISRLRTCEADLQQTKQELARTASEYGNQLSQLERDSVNSLTKIRATNEKTRKEQEEKINDLEQQCANLLSGNTETKKLLEAQVLSATDKIVLMKNEAKLAAERTASELQQLRDRIQVAEQNLIDAQDLHKRQLQANVQKYEQESKVCAAAAREEAKRVALERNEMQRKLSEATTDAACQKVRNEHLQSKLQDESARGELQQSKKDFERVAQLNEKLRGENDKLLLQQRSHQHELQDCERRIELSLKKLQEQEREFSAERLRLRLRIEEENAQQAYRTSLATADDKKKK